MSGTGSASELLRSAIAALARGDAPLLERLAAQAGEVVVGREEQRLAREQHATLGLLLALTRRNLRLLRGGRGAVYGRD
ncbi:MAG TPA: hypothetical protein VHU89_14475 [Acidobacteriaceae bacterium]|jgi:signal transduction histidine kinase|nr:hypothetical protein [Acidobacteriaceae bacterium]